jgi:hypothetical protein
MTVGYFCTYILKKHPSCSAVPVFLNPITYYTQVQPYFLLPFVICKSSQYFLSEKSQDHDVLLFGGGCDEGKTL